METTMRTSEILTTAAAVVRGGWCQGIRHDFEGNVCALGAIETAITGTRMYTYFGGLFANFAEFDAPEAVATLAGVIDPAHRCEPAGVIVNWNNAPDQTAENVAAAFELAALIAAQQETAAVAHADADANIVWTD